MKVTVVKVGGAVVEDPSSLKELLGEFCSLPGAKILVHGGGRTATKVASSMGVETEMVEGRRITSAPMLEIVTMVYGGLVGRNIVCSLSAKGIAAVSLTGADMGIVKAHRRPPVEMSGRTVDFGYVGDVDSVDAKALLSLMEDGVVPVVAPLSFDPVGGTLLNTNADTMAGKVASSLAWEGCDVSLVYCFEKKGVLSDPDDDDSVIRRITPSLFETLKDDGTVSGGMIPKIQNAIDAISSGVGKVFITSHRNISGGTVIERD
ncbi:MAG: acetylglutamate kinase [Bacteroidales bacterium]|nr:acetylglutamate kinase [Bacteroidales bacterium]